MRHFPCFALIATTILASAGGCSLTQPKASTGLDVAAIQAASPTGALRPSGSEEVFRRIKQAKSQNAIVLQVAGDDEPIRVLPLPPDGRSVNVSDLLEQTGAMSRFGNMQVRVFRDSPQQMDGIRMDVKMEGKRIRPECDYALRPGDRIQVRKDDTSRIGKLFGELVPSNAMRAFGGS